MNKVAASIIAKMVDFAKVFLGLETSLKTYLRLALLSLTQLDFAMTNIERLLKSTVCENN